MKKVLLFILICLPICFCGCKNQNKSKLSTPQNLTVETGGIITFERVKGDQYYSISINDDLVLSISINGANVELFNEGDKNYLSFNASSAFVLGDSYSIKVRAEADNKKPSNYTDAVNYTHAVKLEIPTNVRISGTELIWDEVLNADGYQIKIVNPSSNEIISTCSSNRFDFSSVLTEAGRYTFSVSAHSSRNENLSSPFSSTAEHIQVVQLETPKISSIYKTNNGVHAIAVLDTHTDEIVLNINNQPQRVSLTALNGVADKLDVDNLWDLNLTSFLTLSSVKQYSISVQASSFKEFYTDSFTSEEQQYCELQTLITPQIELVENVVKFTPTEQELTEINSQLVGGYQVNLALSSGIKTITNIPKDVYEFELPLEDVLAVSVTKVGTADYALSAVSNWVSVAEQEQSFEVSTTNSLVSWSSGANYYIIEVDGRLEKSEQTSLNLADYGNFSTFKITAIKADYKPSTQTVNGNYTVKLMPPSIGIGQGFNPIQPYVLEFSPVENALGYFVYLKLDSNQEADFIRIDHLFTGTTINLSNQVTHSNEFGTYVVKLQAVADGYERYGKFLNSELSSYSLNIQHKRELNPPTFIFSGETNSPVTKLNNRYYLNFEGVADAYAYELSINSNVIEIRNTQLVYSYDITDYLKTAGKYTFKLCSIKNPNDDSVNSSTYVQYEYPLYLQLSEVQNINVNENDGKYLLSFDRQNNVDGVDGYEVKITNVTNNNYEAYLSSQGLQNPFMITDPDISKYVALEGEYYIYVTAKAKVAPDCYYTDSAISSQPAYLNKLSSLPAPTNLTHNNIDENTFNLVWQEVENADHYTVRIVNTYGEIEEFNTYETYKNINSVITVPGQYVASVKAVVETSSENGNRFISSSFSREYVINYDFETDWDYLRYSVNINNSSYDYQIEDVENLKNILWYHYIFDIDPNFGLKIKIKPNESETTREAIIRFADEASENIYNFNADKLFTDKKDYFAQESELFSYICEQLLKAYPEFNVLDQFSCGSVPDTNNQVYKLFYTNRLKQLTPSDVDSILLPSKDYGDKFNYLSSFVRRADNTPFAIDNKQAMYVTTSEQLLLAITNGYKPHFVGNSQNAETIYANAKAVLRAIVRANMTDYEKTNAIFNWLEYAYNLNYYATYVNKMENQNVELFGNRYDFYLETMFLNLKNPQAQGFDGEFYLGQGIATSFSYSKAFSLLCGIEGIETSLVYGDVSTQGRTQPSQAHVWNKVRLSINDGQKQWYVVDLTFSDNSANWATLSNSFAMSSHLYFLVSDSYYKFTLPVNESKINKAIDCNTSFDYLGQTSFGLNETQIAQLEDVVRLGDAPQEFRYFASYNAETNYQTYSTGFGNAQAFMFNAIIYAKYKQKFVNNTGLAMFEIKVPTSLIDSINLNGVVSSLNNTYFKRLEENITVNIIGGTSGVADTSQNTTTFIFTIENTN